MHIIHQKNQGFNHHATFIRDALFDLREKGVYVPIFGGPWLCTTLQDGVITLNLMRSALDECGAESYNQAERKMHPLVIPYAYNDYIHCYAMITYQAFWLE